MRKNPPFFPAPSRERHNQQGGKAAWTYTGAGSDTLNGNITEGEVALIRDSANPIGSIP